MSQNSCPSQYVNGATDIVASLLSHEFRLNAAHPAAEWQDAVPVTFCSDWQGKNPDPARQTQVRVLWSPHTLYLRFDCRYRELYLFADAEPNGRRDRLWDRDVAEAFLQDDPTRTRYYKEFEVSPKDLRSGLQRSVWLNESAHTWTAELAIPMKSLTTHFDPAAVWRVNFYRVEGVKEPRNYLAWRPTNTPQPNFHVPSAFGRMRFCSAGKP